MQATDLHKGLSAELLRKLLHYEPETGEFTWLVQPRRGVYPGARAGKLHRGSGRRQIKIGGVSYYAARLAWLYMTGEWPQAIVDHVDTDRLNDRWGNLRLASKSENNHNKLAQRNNTSGFKGVYRKRDRWTAIIRKDGVLHHLGVFDTREQAAAAYAAAAEIHFGTFARAA